MADVSHTYSVYEKITVAIKNTVDFGRIQSSGCSRHHQEIVDGIARSVTYLLIIPCSRVLLEKLTSKYCS